MSELVLSIVSGDDDAKNSGTTWPGTTNFDSTTTYTPVGMEENTVWAMAAYRFRNVTIPPGATIESAILSVRAGSDDANEIYWWFAAEKVANPSAFAVGHQPITAYNDRTTAEVQWHQTDTDPWVLGERYSSPDLKTIVQEIVDQAEWASGNSLVLVLWHDETAGTSFRYVEFYDDTPAGTWSPTLTINYSTGITFSNVTLSNVTLGG